MDGNAFEAYLKLVKAVGIALALAVLVGLATTLLCVLVGFIGGPWCAVVAVMWISVWLYWRGGR